MLLTVQPNYYSTKNNFYKTQQNETKFHSKPLANQISFRGDKFDYDARLKEKLNKMNGVEKFFGGRKKAINETTSELIGFNSARDLIEKQKDQTIDAQKASLAAKDEALKEAREKVEIVSKSLEEAKKNNNDANSNQLEIEKLKIELKKAQTFQLEKQKERDVEHLSVEKTIAIHKILKTQKAGIGWAKIAGHEKIKKQLEEAFINKLAIEQGGTEVTMPNAILFYGPKSTGKTCFAKAFAEQAQCNLIEIDMLQSDDEILNAIRNAAIKSKELYENQNSKKRTILLLDECDAIAATTGKKENGSSIIPNLKNFLQQCAEKYKCTVFMTTNHPLRIDTELLADHRVPYQVFLGPPGQEDSAEIFKFYTKGLTAQEIDYNKLAKEVMSARNSNQAFSAARIETIVKKCNEAISRTKQIMTQKNLMDKITELGPDISSDSLEKFTKEIAQMTKKIL